MGFLNFVFLSFLLLVCSGGSRPLDKGGPGHPDPEISRGGQKIFSALRSTNKEGAGLPGPLPWILHWCGIPTCQLFFYSDIGCLPCTKRFRKNLVGK